MILQVERIAKSSRFWDAVDQLAKEAFPPEEYLPPETLVRMAVAGALDFWALTDHDAFVGFMVVQTWRSMAYLFFLAIAEDKRAQGYGSRSLATLRALYPDHQQVVDLEMLDEAAENYSQRKARRSFYLRNGYRATGQFLSYLGVDYEVLCMEDQFDFALFRELMTHISLEGFCPRYFTR